MSPVPFQKNLELAWKIISNFIIKVEFFHKA